MKRKLIACPPTEPPRNAARRNDGTAVWRPPMREESRTMCPAGTTASPRVLEPFLVSRLGNSSHIIKYAITPTSRRGAAAAPLNFYEIK
eukprot:scaffold94098_cov60-Phaeocystis_antarctica.AAC.2